MLGKPKQGTSIARPLDPAPHASDAPAAARVKDEFLANMRHEIRTPLNCVLGMTALLLDTPLDEQQKEMAETARASAESLLRIVEELLDFSRIESGCLRAEESDFDVVDTVESAIWALAPEAHRKGLELTLHIATAVRPAARGDAAGLRQILSHVAGNAVKFTPAGEVAVNVDCSGETETHTALTFTVHHSGTPQMIHAGLGLAVSQRLIEAMGGSIGMVSVPGEGSTLTFTVPLGKDAAAAPHGSDDSLRGARLLVADPHAETRRVVRNYAESWGMIVTEAADTAGAIEALPDCDVALIDEGIEAPDGPPIVLLTRQTGLPVPAQGAGPSWNALAKPVRRRHLHDCLAQSLRQAASGSARILVVEDNVVNQKVTTLLLSRLGYAAEIAPNGREALRAVSSRDFDAVLMDCQMPEMDGYEATREIRRVLKTRLPIIAMTAGGAQDHREYCLAAGMDDYLAKPVHPIALADVLNRWLSVRTADLRSSMPASKPA